MCLLSWRKTNFLCIISILSLKSMSKLINVNCLRFIGCQNYTNVLINRVLYQIQVTALLPFFLSILHLLLQLSKIVLCSTVKLLLGIVMSIIFGPSKTLTRSSKSCDCVTFRVLKYLLSIFLLYTPHCHMILSKQKCCLWSTGVSTESQNLTSVQWWFVYPDTFVPGRYFRINEFSGLLSRLLVWKWKSVPALLSGLARFPDYRSPD